MQDLVWQDVYRGSKLFPLFRILAEPFSGHLKSFCRCSGNGSDVKAGQVYQVVIDGTQVISVTGTGKDHISVD